MNALQMVNFIRRRMRLAAVADFSSEHAQLMLDFLNESKDEVERALGWLDQRDSILVDTVAGTGSYQLLDLRPGFIIRQVFDDTNDVNLRQASIERMNEMYLTGETEQGIPRYWGLNARSSGEVVVDLWPVPDAVYSLIFYTASNPQEWMTSTTDELLVPYKPVLLSAVAKALADRGEANDEELARADKRARDALADAIAADAQNSGRELSNLEPV